MSFASAKALFCWFLFLSHGIEDRFEPFDQTISRVEISENLDKLLAIPFAGQFEFSLDNLGSNSVKAEHTAGWVKVAPFGFVRHFSNDGAIKTYVDGKNDRYIFRAEAIGVSDKFLLTELTPIRDATDFRLQTMERAHKRIESASVPIFFATFDWATIFRSSALALDETTLSMWNGYSSVKLKFRMTRSPGLPTTEAIANGWLPGVQNGEVVLLSDFNYLPVEWSGEISIADDDNMQLKTTVEFDFNTIPPRYTKVTQQRTTQGNLDVQIGARTYKTMEKPMRRELYLSAFGIQEPAYSRSASKTWLYLIFGGCAVVVVAFGWARLRRAS